MEEDEALAQDRGNRWYFFVPLVLVGFWLLTIVASIALDSIAPGADATVLEVSNWIGIMGWTALFAFHLGLASRKRASGWWVLGGFCMGLNLPLYVGLLFLRPRPDVRSAPPLPRALPFGWNESSRPLLLKNCFACDFCDALLNYGVSECYECGERYRYAEGKPVARED